MELKWHTHDQVLSVDGTIQFGKHLLLCGMMPLLDYGRWACVADHGSPSTIATEHLSSWYVHSQQSVHLCILEKTGMVIEVSSRALRQRLEKSFETFLTKNKARNVNKYYPGSRRFSL